VPDRILLIDDDADELRAVGDYFDGIGYDVGRAETAEAGFQAFHSMRPDVVILDLHFSPARRLEVLEQLKSRGGSVILLIEQDNAETAVRAMQIGAEYFLTKPVDLNYLNAATARVCDRVRLTRQYALLREALDRLLSIPWPGKGREMQKIVALLPADLRTSGDAGGSEGTGGGGDGRHKAQALAEVERLHIEKTLRFHEGNRTRAARELGISRATLINKIKAYGLDI
jgi:DNA-binding NtrC family response regulator